MECRPDVSAKGFYYNLEKSPYRWVSPYGDSFQLPSEKRVELMEKRTKEALRRLDKLMEAHDLKDVMPDDLARLLGRYVVKAVYEEIVRR